MPTRIALSKLNASTVDILNTIRANASMQYQNQVPEISYAHEIPQVGQVFAGYPALQNEFISALVNRIGLVQIKSAMFNNAYAELKKGYLEFGETVEEVFVSIAKAREFSREKAAAREFKRTLPDVKSAFHTMNWKVQYPITIEDEELRLAFTSAQGIQDLIAKIINQVYGGAEYDEYLLFKYLIIKAIAHGKMEAIGITDMTDSAEKFRGMSNQLTFMSRKYNERGVLTVTNKADQCIFMDSHFNAKFDVEVLAGAFNMDKADFMGKLYLIDDFSTFDNERFEVIRENSDMIEEVTAEELAICSKVKALLLDKEWFQVYDNLTKMTEVQVASGLYWNYNLTVWKTVSYSPFSNAIVFVDEVATAGDFEATVSGYDEGEHSTVITLTVDDSEASLASKRIVFEQTGELVEAGIAVHPYGGLMIPTDNLTENTLTIVAHYTGDPDTKYEATLDLTTVELGTELSFTEA